MNMLGIYAFSVIALIVMETLCWYVVEAGSRKVRVEVYNICSAITYGQSLGSQMATDLTTCALICMDTTDCESCVYDETSDLCSLNSRIRLDPPTCSLSSLKYIQMGEYKCITSGSYQICGLEVDSVPGQVSGYVLAYINGQWGTVCDDFWEEVEYGAENADVFCRSLGYSTGSTTYPLRTVTSYFEGTSLPVVMDNLKCKGNENHLLDCPNDIINCYHDEDVRVTCTD